MGKPTRYGYTMRLPGGFTYEITAPHREWLDHLNGLWHGPGGQLLTPAHVVAADMNSETVAAMQAEIRRLEGELHVAKLREAVHRGGYVEYGGEKWWADHLLKRAEDEARELRLTLNQQIDQYEQLEARLAGKPQCSVCRRYHGSEVTHECE